MKKDTEFDHTQLGITWFEKSGQFFCANIDQKKVNAPTRRKNLIMWTPTRLLLDTE